ncbi:MAG: CHASE domain-containing protein, partial [Myxococcales bacterium]|nr:CHASE domain-containing protein [Myxococcales bacterium]
MSSSIAPDVNRRRDRRRAGRVFLVGLGVTVVLTILSRGAARRREQALFDDRAAVQAQNIARELTTPLEAAYATATLFEASNEVTAAEFARFVDPQLARHPSIFAMAWIPRVREAERPAFEASLAAAHPGLGIRDPGPDGTFSPSPTRAVHFPVAFLEPPDPRLFGVDLAYDPARLAWVEPAIAHPDVYVTPRYDLVGEATTSGTVAAYAPVFADGARNGTEAERREKLRGVTAAIFRLERTVSQILERYPLDEMRLVLREEGTRGEEGILYSSTGEALGGSRAYGQHRLPVPVANRRWEIELESTDPLSSPLPYVVFVLGVLVSAFVTLAVWLWWRFRRLSHDVARLGQYVLTAKLGEGGMGSVYRAQHVLLRRPTAVKLIRPEYSDKPEAAERFEREVQAASELSHPNSIVVYDYGQTPDGILYYAMEYVEGITLQALVENDGPMPPGRVVAIVAQICGAVAEAHGRGIVHRDL